jgi:hypothetical protein
MRLYLDDDSVDPGLIRLLRRDGHDVQIPADVGLAGVSDQAHLAHAIRDRRAILTRNYKDFEFGTSGNALFTKNRGLGTILNDD